MLKQRFLRIGLAKIGSKIQNLEIFQKSPNVVFGQDDNFQLLGAKSI